MARNSGNAKVFQLMSDIETIDDCMKLVSGPDRSAATRVVEHGGSF